MKIVDANVLLYAVTAPAPGTMLRESGCTLRCPGPTPVGLPWTSLLAFVRISTNARIFDPPLSVAEAMDVLGAWLESPVSVTVEPTPRHAGLLRSLLTQSGTAGNLTMDAHLAALSLEHNAEVVTWDRDLARFNVPVVIPGPTSDQSTS